MTDAIRHVVIFGGSGGIGAALAQQLAGEGCRLTLVARGMGRLAALAAELGADADSADVTDAAATEACVARAVERRGRLDGAVNCVGSVLLKPAHLTTDAEWAQTIAANLTSAFHVVRAVAPVMMRAGGGSVVLVASAVALRGMVNHEAIAAAKAGVVGLARSAAATYARYGVRFNCVAPGLTRTPMTEGLWRQEANQRASVALHPLGRLGEAAEVAGAIRWFLAAEQSWVTGQVLAVDGGLSSVQARPAGSPS